MQEALLPDYLDGSRQSKNPNLMPIVMACALTPYIKPVNKCEMVISFPPGSFPTFNGIPLYDLVPIVGRDESMKVFLRAYKGYREKPNKNYIVYKDLVFSLIETKLDIKCKYLPSDFTAFLDLKGLIDSDGDEIKGVFVDITSSHEKMIYLGIVTFSKNPDHYAISHLNLPLDDGERAISNLILDYKQVYSSVKPEILERYDDSRNIENKGDGFYQIVSQGGYHKSLHAILNAILYIHYSQEDCLEKENIFSTKKSKYEAQKKIFTSRKFIELGKNFVFPREYSCGEVGVSGHFRWQPHGPNRSLMKRIYIKPHTRVYGSGEN